MELRMDTSHKENVPPSPTAPLRPDARRFLESLGVSLGSGHGPWGSPAASPFPGAALPAQTSLASPSLGLALKDTASSLATCRFRQQSNLHPQAGRPRGRAREFPVQQTNLSTGGPGLAERGSRSGAPLWPEPRESVGPHMLCCGSPRPRQPLARLSPRPRGLPATGPPCPDVRPAAGFGSLEGRTWPGPRSWGGPASRTYGPMGESLTLEDLAVPAQSRPRAPSRAAIHQLLASVQHLEQQVARLGRRAPQKPPGPAQRVPRHHRSQGPPVRPQPSQPVLASWGAGKRPPSSPRDPADFLETRGVRAGVSGSVAGMEPAWPEATVGQLPGDPKQGVRGEGCSAGPPGVRGQGALPRLPGAALRVPPGQERGEGALGGPVCGKEETMASSAPNGSPTQSALQNKAQDTVTLEMDTACRQLLSRCFRAWWHSVQRRQAGTEAEALRHGHLLRKGLRVLRGARLEAARGRHTKALLACSFREWKHLAAQRKQGQPHIQAGPGLPVSGGGRGQGPLGRKAVVDPAQRHSVTLSLGSLREVEGAQWLPGRRPDGRDERAQILQALQQLAVFLLWCRQKGWAGQDRGVAGEAAQAPPRTQRMERQPQARRAQAADTARRALLGTWGQRVRLRRLLWLQTLRFTPRCFAAWQRFVQRGAQCRDHLADLRLGTLRTCLRQWVQMQQLRASDGAKVTQLSLCRQKAEPMARLSSAPGAATAHSLRLVAQAQGLPPGRGLDSLQEACRRLALRRALLLWRMRLSQRQRADAFFQGMQRRTLRRVLRRWHWRMWPLFTQTTPAPEPGGSALGREASLACSTPRGSLRRATPRVSLQAAGRWQQGQCDLLWQAPAQQSQGTARWCRRTLQRRVLLSWSHWAAAQGARRELAARWAWGRSCRATLGTWRQRLAQRREVGQWARERSQALARGSLRHWYACWQRQRSLRDKYQPWVQLRLQGLRRAAFWRWQWAAAHRRHRVAGQERLLLQRALEAWAQAVARGHVQRAAIAQPQQAECRRLLQTQWAQWRAALLRGRLGPRVPAEETAGPGTICPEPGADCRHCQSLATRGRLLLLMDAPAPWKQPGSCWTQATGLVPPGPPWLHGPSTQRKQRETSWAQSDRKHALRLPPGPHRPPLRYAFRLWLPWPVHCDWAWGPPLWTRSEEGCSSETGARQGRGVARQRQLGSKYLQCWRFETRLRRLQGSWKARLLAATWQRWVDAQETEQLARTLSGSRAGSCRDTQESEAAAGPALGLLCQLSPQLRQWHLGRAWGTWRRRVLQLRVAQRVQQQEDGRVLSQAFEKWHQCLTARGLRTGGTSCPRPQSKPGTTGPGNRPKDTRAVGMVELGWSRGPAAVVDLFP